MAEMFFVPAHGIQTAGGAGAEKYGFFVWSAAEMPSWASPVGVDVDGNFEGVDLVEAGLYLVTASLHSKTHIERDAGDPPLNVTATLGIQVETGGIGTT
jgi:hypothetical protein